MEDGNPKNSVTMKPALPTIPGGYDIGGATLYNQVGVLPPSDITALTCSKCSYLLKEPRQVITCGHRYCQLCIEQMTSGDNGPFLCLVDQESFVKTEIRNDKGCLRDILALEVTCPTTPPCTWRGKLVDMEIHRERCPNKKVKCSLGCGGLFQDGDLETHMTSECPKRLCSCEHCKQDIPLDSIQEHYGVCEEHPVPCDYCQTELPARKQLTSHLEQDCEEYYMDCSHATCTFKGRKADMLQHILGKHLIQSMERMNGMETKMTALQSENEALRKEIESLQNIVLSIPNKDGPLKEEKQGSLQSSVHDLQTQVEKLKHANQQKDVDILSLKSLVNELQKERDERELAKIQIRSFGDAVEKDCPTVAPKRNGIFNDGVTNSSPKPWPTNQPEMDDTRTPANLRDMHLKALECPYHLQREPVLSVTGMPDLVKPEAVMSHVKQKLETQQTHLLKLNDSVQALQDNLTRYSVAIDEVRLRQDVLDVKTTNGILIWKIPDIRRRFRDAVDRRTISLYSPPFYTSPHGYRMCIRTYLNGDGIGKGTHISLFFVVMRSEQDNLLSFPFKQSVRFTLVNQKNPASSITEAFVPDLNSPSFQKPENDMNIASGFPKFARQSILHDENFTSGNAIFIKCQVDLAGLTAQ